MKYRESTRKQSSHRRRALEIALAAQPDLFPLHSHLIQAVAHNLCFQERFAEAEAIFRDALDRAQKQDAPPLIVAGTRTNVGYALLEQGCNTAAEDWLQATLVLYDLQSERNFGLSAWCVSLLARTIGNQKRYTDAMTYHWRALRDDSETDSAGNRHSVILRMSAYENIERLGLHADAEYRYRDLLEEVESSRGSSDELIASVASHLAVNLDALDRGDEAWVYHRRAIDTYEHLGKVERTEYLMCLIAACLSTIRLGWYLTETEKVLREILAVVLGRRARRPEALGFTQYVLARNLLEQGRLIEAEGLFREAISEQFSGEINARRFLARCLDLQGRHIAAWQMYQVAYRKALVLNGTGYLDSGYIAFGLAKNSLWLGREQTAYILGHLAYDNFSFVFGPDHRVTQGAREFQSRRWKAKKIHFRKQIDEIAVRLIALTNGCARLTALSAFCDNLPMSRRSARRAHGQIRTKVIKRKGGAPRSVPSYQRWATACRTNASGPES